MSEVKGYKVFNPDWTCRGFQYEVGKIFEEAVVIEVFIFVKKLLNVLAITVLILKIGLQKLLHLVK